MKRKSPIREKLYRDPVHDIIPIDVSGPAGQTLVRLVDARETQRLRRIRQLGLAYFAFQGAEHSRFAHAIGTMHLMGVVLRQLKKGYEIDREHIFLGQCAALLHDVGHGPFSHVFERFTEKHHEEWSRDVILSEESEVFEILASHSLDLPAQVSRVLHTRDFRPGTLTDLISSQLDVDRFDYLSRDNLVTGVKHGVFDLERLIHVLRINTKTDRVVLADKGVHPVEKYLQARYHMYRQVYQHKTVVAAEAMLTALLRRVADLLGGVVPRAGRLPAGLAGLTLPPLVPKLLAGRGKGMTVAEYTRLDDPMMYYAISELQGAPDPVAADLARRLLGRGLFKAIEVDARAVLAAEQPRRRRGRDAAAPEAEGPAFRPEVAERVEAARDLVRRRGLDPAYYFLIIESSDTPYRPYDPTKHQQKNIEIEVPGGGTRDISEVSEIVRALQASNYNLIRFVFPASDPDGRDLREEMEALLGGLASAPA